MRLQNIVLSLLLTAVSSTAVGAGSASQPDICDRQCWEARPPASTPSQMSGLNRGVIHHTAFSGSYETSSIEESKAYVRGVQNYHMDVNGWSDVGYHFLGDRLGNGFEGRIGSIDSLPRGAHDGVNSNSMGYSMMGYFHDPYNQLPSEEIRCAIYSMIAWKTPDPYTGFGSSAYGSRSDVGYLAGHRDVSSTACPGDLMYLDYIGTDFTGGEARTEINSMISSGEGQMCAGGLLCCPGAPTLNAVLVTNQGVSLNWSDVGDVQAYRVYITIDVGGVVSDTMVELPGGQTLWVDTDAAPGELRTYEVSAVGTSVESISSDSYAARITSGASTVLVVDGNDRWLTQGENSNTLNHDFAAVAGAAVPSGVGFDTVDNGSVVAGAVSLQNYEAVVWTLGEESTRDETFSSAEQVLVDTYLNSAGRLFVSGAEVGWDLAAQGDSNDQEFYNYKLRASYVGDDAGVSVASAQPGGIFDGLGPLDFGGGEMLIDYPDVIAPWADASAELYYSSIAAGDAEDLFAAVSYDGAFKVVYFGFPFESLSNATMRGEVMSRVLDFFGVAGEDGGSDGVSIGSIDLSVIGRGRLRAVAKVQVLDDRGRPVEGATVAGTFSGDVDQQLSAITARTGSASLVGEPLRVPDLTFNFCVDQISGEGIVWDTSADAETCDTYELVP